MNVFLLTSKVARTLRYDGLLATFRKIGMHFRRGSGRDDFDLRYGTDTSHIEPLWKFKIHSPNVRFGVRYQPTDESEFTDAVTHLHENLQTLTFVDLGCGKGRALLLAAFSGFAKVIGVEFAPELVKIARSNLAKMNLVNSIVEHGDAADFHFPSDDLVVYLHNPFSGPVLDRVAANLRALSKPRRLYVIYHVPLYPEAFDSIAFLSRFETSTTKRYIIWKPTEHAKALAAAN